ncbi:MULTISPECIES: CbrC family protein [unclassified Moraxella]|uniref:CbrC family protein n=1 Tax=unclassified Moraxella TaxID=2685852 RepID=UPI003AF7116E
MNYPIFKYHPNAYDLDIFIKEQGVCDVCGKPSELKYDCSFYSAEELDYICPFCISDGSASNKYGGQFNNYLSIETVEILETEEAFLPKNPNKLFDEIAYRTPSYHSWQQQYWLTHCNEPCAFISYADVDTIRPLLDELIEDIENSGYPAEMIRNELGRDSELAGYLFQCVKCGKYRLYVDAS